MSDFKADVLRGLTAPEKFLLSKYIYNEQGIVIFQEILELEEYYVPAAENEIIVNAREEIFTSLGELASGINLIELGPGNGQKVLKLAEAIPDKSSIRYSPVDISVDFLDETTAGFRSAFPKAEINKFALDFTQQLSRLPFEDEWRNMVVFFGSSLGNLLEEERQVFFGQLSQLLRPGDMALIGFDTVKSPRLIFDAYNDPKGVTARFNLNLLDRINRELNGNFDLGAFEFFASYSPESGEVNSYLVSLKDQSAFIEALNLTVHFKAFEPIYTELSKKFRIDEINGYANSHGFEIVENFRDSNERYCLSLWRKA